MRRALPLLALLLALGATASGAETSLSPAQAEAARAWRGRFCAPTGCGPPPAATAGSMLGFAVAALGAGWVSRRRGRSAR